MSAAKLDYLLDSYDDSLVTSLICQRSLKEYIKTFWGVVEPGTEFIDNWHIDAICEHLEAVTKGEIRNLVINMPPRCMKSLLVSVMWQTWVWTFKPDSRWLYASYGQNLSTRDTLKARRIITSPLYQSLFSHIFKLTGDQNTKTRFENDQTGYRIATSVDGAGTGEGGDFIVVDDPQNATEAYSEAKVEATIEWWDMAMSTRGNNPKTVAKVIVMQRLAESDLSGHVLNVGGYEHLMLPMEYEADRKCITSIGWEDPRKKEGELLWPARVGEAENKAYKSSLGSFGYAGQMQQRPAPREGAIIKLSWIQEYAELPHAKNYSWSWDTAIKAGQENDYSVGMLWAECDNGYYLVDMFRQRVEYPDLRKMVAACFDKHKAHEVIVEDKASGQQIVQDFKRISNMPIIPVIPGRDMPGKKDERMQLVAPLFEAGKVFIPRKAEWRLDFINEITTFPSGKHDDICDATTQYLARRLNAFNHKPNIRIL